MSPDREGRIDALEAVKEGASQVVGGSNAAQVAEVFKLMPTTKENRLRNYLDKKRKKEMKAKRRAEREAALGVGSAGALYLVPWRGVITPGQTPVEPRKAPARIGEEDDLPGGVGVLLGALDLVRC